MRTCASCQQPIEAEEPARTFVWLGAAYDPYIEKNEPDLFVHERCLPRWRPPDSRYHDTKEPFPDTGM